VKSKRAKRRFSAEEKVAILKRHLVDKVAVSDLCEEYRIQPSLFYVWQRQMWEILGAAFQEAGRKNGGSAREAVLTNQVDTLKAALAEKDAKLAKKDRVIAEISEEFVKLKNSDGDL
jgi:transposase-like protein